MKKNFLVYNNRGQVLMELVIAVGIISTGLFASWMMFFSGYIGEKEAGLKVTASNLAKEGAEAVRNIRDSNWLKISDGETIQWNAGLSGDGSGVIVGLLDVDDIYINYDPDSIDSPLARLYTNDQGLYSSDDSGSVTPFSRLVSIAPICCDDYDYDLQCDEPGSSSLYILNPGDSCGGGLQAGIDVKVEVKWSIEGNNRNIVIKDQLFNWRL